MNADHSATMTGNGPPVSTNIDILRVRAVLGRREWAAPARRGVDSWVLSHATGDGSVIVSCAPYPLDEVEWVHASMTRRGRAPSYEDLVRLHRAVFGVGWAYQVFAPPGRHVNIHEHALHLWGRLDGGPALPDFTLGGDEI